jgi:hypothetical protein
MVGRMIIENTLHRPIRTVVSVLAVAIEVGMIMLVVGLTHGMLTALAAWERTSWWNRPTPPCFWV